MSTHQECSLYFLLVVFSQGCIVSIIDDDHLSSVKCKYALLSPSINSTKHLNPMSYIYSPRFFLLDVPYLPGVPALAGALSLLPTAFFLASVPPCPDISSLVCVLSFVGISSLAGRFSFLDVSYVSGASFLVSALSLIGALFWSPSFLSLRSLCRGYGKMECICIKCRGL